MMLFGIFLSLAWAERTPLGPQPLIDRGIAHRLTIKFLDKHRVRIMGDGSLSLQHPQLIELIKLNQLEFTKLIPLAAEKLEMIERKAKQYSNKEQPDLGGMMIVSTQKETDLVKLGNALQRLDIVEYVNLENLLPPPPGDIAPATDNYQPSQLYLQEDPGINAVGLWDLGYSGSRVRIADIEYGWQVSHEDLVDQVIVFEADQTIPSWVATNGWDSHGTAVLGETSAVNNGYGCTGISYDSSVFLYPEYSDEQESRRASAIASAIVDLSPGDVLMLEMQDYGDPDCGQGPACYVPAEMNPDVWTMTRMAVDAGIVVVAAAGNGGEDLDGQWYVDNYLSRGDSGAIIVGGGSPDLDHGPFGLSFGSRVNLQGWGYDVFTLGYELIEALGNDPYQAYTGTFSGTSSATPVVAGAAALVQDFAIDQLGYALHPEGLRTLLIYSGIPQTGTEHIGPLPDVVAGVELLLVSDQDGDGDIAGVYGGADCDDTASEISSFAEEEYYDGIDQNCDGLSDYDADQDGEDSSDYGGLDCDDNDPLIGSFAEEEYYDGVDQNCDGLSDYDFDQDGEDSSDYGGLDCDDNDPLIGSFAEEEYYDGVDQNCDGLSDYDADQDGDDSLDYGGLDCDDSNAEVSGISEEVYYDGVDQNCDGLSDYDADQDGYDSSDYDGLDCDDNDLESYPGATEILDDLIDQNCDGVYDKSPRQSCSSAGFLVAENIYILCFWGIIILGRRKRKRSSP